MKATEITTIDQYIAGFPEEIQQVLNQVRATIRKAAPDATEAISYGMPAFKQDGYLAYFAAYKNHIGFYPIPPATEKFKEELSVYKTGKGSVQFPIDQPMPLKLITKMIKFRIQVNAEKAALKVKKK
ncbi:iron chaperone [Chitinophaga sp. 22321]|uniref:DUF1801 domain-containing protein n=1 Tax=Chitinophaga hostae TaxID=2831022 RepID=A0ABS5IYM3_9BACT|nr:DUF1801 domain-containing protein [Chitinophaga hostae]MBS0028069.1 DUF1801 domain-containing protein [Chitinophaga hostae]